MQLQLLGLELLGHCATATQHHTADLTQHLQGRSLTEYQLSHLPLQVVDAATKCAGQAV